MLNVIAISGSLRKNSYNTALLESANKLTNSMNIEVCDIREIPLYNGDVEKEVGIPMVVKDIQNRIENADAIILATPEYNNGMPGVLKNTIDWLTRPADKIEVVFANKPLAMFGATAGGFGTVSAQTNWLPVLRFLRVKLFNQMPFMLSHAHKCFDQNLNLFDEDSIERLKLYLDGFENFVRS